MAEKRVAAVDVLRRMRTILRKGWVQGYYAKDPRGDMAFTDEKNAVAFCLVGAQMRAVDDLHADDLRRTTARLIQSCLPRGCKRRLADGRDPQVAFNDAKGRKKSEILKVVDCAIAKAKSA